MYLCMRLFVGCLLACIALTYKVFLLGGAVEDDESDIYTLIAKESGRVAQPNNCSDDWNTTPCPRIAIVTSASPTTDDGNDEYYVEEEEGLMSFEQLYKFYGFSPKHVTAHIDNYQLHTNATTNQGKANLFILQNADVIMFNGGDQSRHARTWLKDDGTPNEMFSIVASRAAADKVVLGGTSAGTMIMGNPTYGYGSSFGQLYFHKSYGLAQKQVKDGEVDGTALADVRNGTQGLLYDYNGGKMPGFGFVLPNIVTDTHFDRRSRLARLIPAIKDMNKTFGIGVDEGATFYLKNDQGIALGRRGVFIADLSAATFTAEKYFSIRGARVHYLTPGDQFNFSNRKLTSTKELIQEPQFMSYSDSTDITSRYEMTRLITVLMDQAPNYNIGRTSEQEDFPADTPTFTIRFSRDAKTKGFRKGDQYTAENVLVSISSV